MPIRKHYYFVSYAWQNTLGGKGYGNNIVSLNTLIMDADVLREMESIIRKGTGYNARNTAVVILFFHYLREEMVDTTPD